MLPVYVLASVLVVVLVLANITMAANKTALDADHTIETLGEENVYGKVTTVVQNDTVERVNQTIERQKQQRREERISNRGLSEGKREIINREIDQRLPDHEQQRAFVTDAITRRFIRGELTRTIRTMYAVLNGERGGGQIAVKLAQQQDTLNQSIREALQDNPGVDRDEIVRLVAGKLPDEQNLTENGTVPSESTSAPSRIGLLDTLNLLFPVFGLVLLGGMFCFTGRDVNRTVKNRWEYARCRWDSGRQGRSVPRRSRDRSGQIRSRRRERRGRRDG